MPSDYIIHGNDMSCVVDVSVTWMLKYFHSAILMMAINEYWNSGLLQKALGVSVDGKSHFPTFRVGDDLDHSLSIQAWKYGEFRATGSVGATVNNHIAGCAREAMKVALE